MSEDGTQAYPPADLATQADPAPRDEEPQATQAYPLGAAPVDDEPEVPAAAAAADDDEAPAVEATEGEASTTVDESVDETAAAAAPAAETKHDDDDPAQAQIRKAISDFLSSADLSSLTIKSVTNALKDDVGKKVVKQYKKFIKQTIAEQVEARTGGATDGDDAAAPSSPAASAGGDDNEEDDEIGGNKRSRRAAAAAARAATDGDDTAAATTDDALPANDGITDDATPGSLKFKVKLRRKSDGAASDEETKEDAENIGDDRTSARGADDDYEVGDEDGKKKKKKGDKEKKKKSKSRNVNGVLVQAPKKARSPYQVFCRDTRKGLQAENPKADKSAISKLLSAKWKSLKSSQKKEFEDKAAKDKARFDKDFAQYKTEDPEGAAELMEKLGAKKKGKKGDRSDPSTGEHKSLIDQVIDGLKPKRRKKDEKLGEEENKLRTELGDALLKKMHDADEEDRDLFVNKQPAVRKMMLLQTVIIQCSKIGTQGMLIDAGLLRAINAWLTPLESEANTTPTLPNTTIRTELYQLLAKLPIDTDHLQESGGLGKLLVQLAKHPQETPENKIALKKLLERWIRPIAGSTTNYKQLAQFEREKHAEMQKRKLELGYKDMYPFASATKRAKIPMPATFDYSVRPKGLQQDDDDEKSNSKKKEENRKSRINAKLKGGNSARLQALDVDLTGGTIAVN